MRKLLLATTALLVMAAAPASATVLLATHGQAGTGDNVVFDTASGNLARALLNGQHTNIVHFTDLDGNFAAGSVSGNDIKIVGIDDINVQVFNSTETTVVGTSKQVFSLKGTGSITLTVNAVNQFGVAETPFVFTGNGIDNSQNFFILTVKDGEVMTGLEIKDVGGMISDFEHYRIDVTDIPQVAAVPEASTWAMLVLGFAGIGLMGVRQRGRKFRLA